MNKLYPSRLSRRFGADPVTPESHTQTNSLAGIRHKELIILSHSAEGLWVLVPWASQGRHLQPGSHQQPDEHSPRPCNSLSLLSRSFSPVFQHCKAAAQLLLLLPFSMATRPVPETNWGWTRSAHYLDSLAGIFSWKPGRLLSTPVILWRVCSNFPASNGLPQAFGAGEFQVLQRVSGDRSFQKVHGHHRAQWSR